MAGGNLAGTMSLQYVDGHLLGISALVSGRMGVPSVMSAVSFAYTQFGSIGTMRHVFTYLFDNAGFLIVLCIGGFPFLRLTSQRGILRA